MNYHPIQIYIIGLVPNIKFLNIFDKNEKTSHKKKNLNNQHFVPSTKLNGGFTILAITARAV